MSILRWIHISDLHWNRVGTQTDLMRRKLPGYLSQIAQDRKIDYIFFTGDIRYAPLKTYSDEIAAYFAGLCDATNISSDKLFVVPGNHDVNRGNKKRLEAIAKVEATYLDADGVIDKEVMRGLKSGRDRYNELMKKILVPSYYEHHVANDELHYVITTEHVNIVHIDSTITYSQAKQQDFFIGSYELKKALDKCDPVKPTIILSHYPFDCFNAIERDTIMKILHMYNVQLWLAGHEHHFIAEKIRDYLFAARSGNQNKERNTTPSFIEGVLDTDLGVGYFMAHYWIHNRGWAVYPLLLDPPDDEVETDGVVDTSRFYFILDSWLRANGKTAPAHIDAFFAMREFLQRYRGKTITRERLKEELGTKEEILNRTIESLKRQRLLTSLDAFDQQWRISKEAK